MRKLRALLTFGTRPEAVKMAPVVHECLRQAERIETIVCLTGQHREMLDQVTGYFGIEADCD
ncbi:MAG: UDP-N-acetylglucosamine 2-epimerase (non-hydrolyzing), partial [Pirellulaceae bacterium]|nr:UDP-N-acetylglucosamine 2-epimerase (non-hydrolyzing) [Pirellulaceae bacterium]